MQHIRTGIQAGIVELKIHFIQSVEPFYFYMFCQETCVFFSYAGSSRRLDPTPDIGQLLLFYHPEKKEELLGTSGKV